MAPIPAPTEERTDIEEMVNAAVPPPSCEWQDTAGGPFCGAEAAWMLSLSCGHLTYYCDDHGRRMHAQLHRIKMVACVEENGRPPHHPVPMAIAWHDWSAVL